MLLLEHFTIYGRQILDPQPGTMVALPSWLQHHVHPYFGPGERISVAFNAIPDHLDSWGYTIQFS